MKFLAVIFLALVAVTSSKSIDFEDAADLENLTAYGYHNKIGIPLAEEIRVAETSPQGRIANGSYVQLRQIPYQAGLLLDVPGGQSVCGGTIINDLRILTAAHCWWDGHTQARNVTVVYATVTLFVGGGRMHTTDVVIHDNWNPNLIRNDIAIIKLPYVIFFQDHVHSIRLPSGSVVHENLLWRLSTASGFGRTGDGPNDGINERQWLKAAVMRVISNDECARNFGIIVDTNICATGIEGGSTCGGDSGGPLTLTYNYHPILIGVASFVPAVGCQRGLPSAFTRVTSYLDWIQARM